MRKTYYICGNMISIISQYFKPIAVAILMLLIFDFSFAQEKIERGKIKSSASDSSVTKKGSAGIDNFNNFSNSSNPVKDSVKHVSILDLLEIKDKSNKSYSWRFNPITYNTEQEKSFDTLLFQPQLIYPYQKDLSFYHGVGNLGAPVQSISFIERNIIFNFLFSKNLEVYQKPTLSRIHYNVKTPHTLLEYSNGGKSSQASQILSVIHTQNINEYINFGLEFNYYNDKGMYSNQLTRDNDFAAFLSYYKDKVFGQLTINSSSIKNQENGGITNEYYLVDTVMESRLVPMKLEDASTELKKKSISLMGGYNLIEKKKKYTDVKGKDSTVIKPIISAKVIFELNRFKRNYIDAEKRESSLMYSNFYVSPTKTHDTISYLSYSTTALIDINQIAKYPGIPGLRAWLTNTSGRYNYFKIDDYLYLSNANKISTNHLGIGVYSKSKYLNYSGAMRLYLNGYRAGDKEIFGEISLLPWKSKDLPYIKGEISIDDLEPDIFIKDYFSNHYKWNNNFEKQSIFRLEAEIGADKWATWIGYNIEHISNYTFFNSNGLPEQSSDGVNVTSAYIRNHLKLGWFRFVNKLLWQANTNEDVLSLPQLSLYSSFYLEHDLVKNVLRAQLGVNVFCNSKYYADGYIPAIGQFYNQRNRKIGGYPYADVFINMKWKTAIIFLKYEHINQGYPNNDFFVSYRYPANQQAFKFGISWMFYN